MRARALLCASLLLAGCAAGDGSAALPDPTPPPAPTGEVVLTVVDAAGDQTLWDLDALRGIGTREAALHEPFIDEDTTFTGVPMADVLVHSGIAAGQTVRLSALDDYAVDLPLDGLARERALLALAEAGRDIPLEAGGPIRLVFDQAGPLASNQDNWIWSIHQVEVVP